MYVQTFTICTGGRIKDKASKDFLLLRMRDGKMRQVPHAGPRVASGVLAALERRIGRILYPHVNYKLPLLIGSIPPGELTLKFHSYRGTTCATTTYSMCRFSRTGLSAHSLAFHFSIAQILIELITRHAFSVAPFSQLYLNRRCSLYVWDCGFVYLPLEGHRASGALAAFGPSNQSDLVSACKLLTSSSILSRPGELSLKFSFVPWSYMCVDNVLDVPISDNRLVGALIGVSFACSAVFISRSCNTFAAHLQVQFFNLRSLTVPYISYKGLETRILLVREWRREG
ncbi:hypothetical protein EVAR_29768_1 [Eumeta japonica]|uniref:Uncharacterized protein n=1 Tax=Eumeta variegata TaxID=151549 RepID=A0A4C1WTT2_EUMVA|nr:hypothetical protein EVAR_29768_1 [Eumeta japonica]